MSAEKEKSVAQSEKAKIDNRARLGEITAVLRKHQVTRGVTPEKLRAILEELGPTYVKLGQIMSLHSDVLPQKYCDELMKLTSEVKPMPFETVEEVINRSYREDWHNIFSSIEKETLGSASIAQVHKAKLLDGELALFDQLIHDLLGFLRGHSCRAYSHQNDFLKSVTESAFHNYLITSLSVPQ